MDVCSLFTPTEFSSVLKLDRTNFLKVTLFNMQSAVKKADQRICFLQSLSGTQDIIFLSETWYHSDIDGIAIPVYSSYFLNRSRKHGDGVAILIKSGYTCDELSNHVIPNSDIETLTARPGQLTFSSHIARRKETLPISLGV